VKKGGRYSSFHRMQFGEEQGLETPYVAKDQG
jgi:hypothetical protein